MFKLILFSYAIKKTEKKNIIIDRFATIDQRSIGSEATIVRRTNGLRQLHKFLIHFGFVKMYKKRELLMKSYSIT